jgi:T5SS/PEP-CTERM-associated repeat protein
LGEAAVPSGYIYSWTGKVSSAFGTAGNWYNTTAAATATAVPGTSDEALIVANGSITGPGAVFDLGVSGSGAGLSVAGTLYGSYAYVGGTVTLGSGAAIASPNLIDIGDNSSSTIASKVATLLTVGSGAFITATSAAPNTFDILVGQGAGASGTLAVNGTGIASAGTAGLWVGNGGNGVITVSGGGQVQSGTPAGSATRQIDLALGSNGGTGTMIVSGAQSFGDFTNTVEVGFGGTGLLTVSGGAVLDAGEGLDSLNIGDVYNGAIGSGTVTIDASTAYLAGVIEVGAYGQGSLDLSNGATVDAYFYLPGTPPA